MKSILRLFGALGLLACAGWTLDAVQASTLPMGGMRFNFSIGLAGGSLSFALLCFFGAKVLEGFEDQTHYLIQIRDRLNVLAGPTVTPNQAATDSDRSAAPNAAVAGPIPSAQPSNQQVNPKYAPGRMTSVPGEPPPVPERKEPRL